MGYRKRFTKLGCRALLRVPLRLMGKPPPLAVTSNFLFVVLMYPSRKQGARGMARAEKLREIFSAIEWFGRERPLILPDGDVRDGVEVKLSLGFRSAD
eukprot:941124-Amorphochlora_amoeboformis.AAC.1